MTTATAVPDQCTWLYLKLYPGHLDLLDATLTEVVAPLVDRVASSDERWFYLRYLDGSGPHVRLRFLVSRDQADSLVLQRPLLLKQLAELTGRPRRTTTPVLPAFPPGETGSRPDVRFDLYEPEFAKWGGPHHLETAERVFQASSATALRLIAASDGTVEYRLSLGRTIVTRLLDGLGLNDVERDGFLRTHYTWWSGLKQVSAEEGVARDANLRAAHERIRSAVLEKCGRLSESAHLIDMVNALCADMLIGIERRGAHQKPMYLAFHHLHLTLNRLGVAPVEEALVSLLAGPGTGAAAPDRKTPAFPSEES
ncbi:thiopeptide-type bacteriocin biosynthesis protein [Kitasatospora sp. NPDC048545]|uniref:thiopeptide-type bacteriocin biosynthesis protein n=1 Tax=Kitasatospora sp. NPDC048545 TaxID=3157208 RepID=UPI0033FBEDD9